MVKGFSIERLKTELPDELTYQLTWRDRSDTVRWLTEWQLRWFSSQMRRIATVLERESAGTVRWSSPWAQVYFRQRMGPVEELSTQARAILMEEVRAQRRIDRDAIAARFHEVMHGNQPAVLALIGGEQSDWRYVSDWCEAHARGEDGVKVARLDSGSSDPGDLKSLIAVVLNQWREDLPPAVNEDRAIDAMRKALNVRQPMILLALRDGPKEEMDRLLELIISADQTAGAAARVIVLIGAEAPPPSVGTIPVESFDLRSLGEADLDHYLDGRYGYGAEERSDLIAAMRNLELLGQPAKVYQYIQDRCDHAAWTSGEES